MLPSKNFNGVRISPINAKPRYPKLRILLSDFSIGSEIYLSSISISNINKYAYLLSDGKIPFIPEDEEIPTILQLKKDIKDLELVVKSIIDKEISIVYNDKNTPEDTGKYYALKVLVLLKTYSLSKN